MASVDKQIAATDTKQQEEAAFALFKQMCDTYLYDAYIKQDRGYFSDVLDSVAKSMNLSKSDYESFLFLFADMDARRDEEMTRAEQTQNVGEVMEKLMQLNMGAVWKLPGSEGTESVTIPWIDISPDTTKPNPIEKMILRAVSLATCEECKQYYVLDPETNNVTINFTALYKFLLTQPQATESMQTIISSFETDADNNVYKTTGPIKDILNKPMTLVSDDGNRIIVGRTKQQPYRLFPMLYWGCAISKIGNKRTGFVDLPTFLALQCACFNPTPYMGIDVNQVTEVKNASTEDEQE